MYPDPRSHRFDPDILERSDSKAVPIHNLLPPSALVPHTGMLSAGVEVLGLQRSREEKLRGYANNLARHDVASGLCAAEGLSARVEAWNKLLLLVDTERFERIFIVLDLLSSRDAQKIRKAITTFPEVIRNYEESVSAVYDLGLDRALLSFFEPVCKVDGHNTWIPFHTRVIQRVEEISTVMGAHPSLMTIDPCFTLFTHNLNILCESLLDRRLEPHTKSHPVFELRRFAKILADVAQRNDGNDQVLRGMVEFASMMLSDGF
jgi:hypothetical protein